MTASHTELAEAIARGMGGAACPTRGADYWQFPWALCEVAEPAAATVHHCCRIPIEEILLHWLLYDPDGPYQKLLRPKGWAFELYSDNSANFWIEPTEDDACHRPCCGEKHISSQGDDLLAAVLAAIAEAVTT